MMLPSNPGLMQIAMGALGQPSYDLGGTIDTGMFNPQAAVAAMAPIQPMMPGQPSGGGFDLSGLLGGLSKPTASAPSQPSGRRAGGAGYSMSAAEQARKVSDYMKSPIQSILKEAGARNPQSAPGSTMPTPGRPSFKI